MKRPWILVCGLFGCAIFFSTFLHATHHSSSRRMKRQIIRTHDAPSSPLYSQTVKIGPTIYVTGIVGIDPRTTR